jgi:BASS family bile acid:Na+ symporter
MAEERARSQNSMWSRWLLGISGISLVAFLAAALLGGKAFVGPPFILMLAALAIYFQTKSSLKVFTFTFWVFAFTAAALFYPVAFLSWGGFELKRLNVPLIQLIMFGMGASLSFADFARAVKMPKAVLIGMLLQFTVMPLAGWSIAHVFGFEPEVAAGVILIGSCSGGVASNVMAYLARANVALSVTMTACSTLLAPLMTPTAMKILAGRLVPIPFIGMMISIIKMIILPIVAGLIANWLLHGRRKWLDRILPVVSMAAICFIIAIIAANSRNELLTAGFLLIGAAAVHNTIGYTLGYFGARAARLSETDCRTVAIEVGMQNGGMAVGLAIDVLKSTNAALAPAIFGTWMNVSGSTLASWWRERIPADARGEGSNSSGEARHIEAMPTV